MIYLADMARCYFTDAEYAYLIFYVLDRLWNGGLPV